MNKFKGKTIIILALTVFLSSVILSGCSKNISNMEEKTQSNALDSSSVQKSTEETDSEVSGSSSANSDNQVATESSATDSKAVEEQDADIKTDSEKSGYTIVIDPGHQLHGSNEQEPIGPGAEETKARVTSGTQGISTGNTEFQLNLTVSLLLRDELEARGYHVVMTRETNEVDLSNVDRANIANESNADIFVRIHANSDNDSSINGVLTMSPTESNPYVSSLYEESSRLSELLVNNIASETGASNRGVMYTDDMSGINWSQIPVSIVEMGFMSNPNEDELLGDSTYQQEIVAGIADGIDEYFQ